MYINICLYKYMHAYIHAYIHTVWDPRWWPPHRTLGHQHSRTWAARACYLFWIIYYTVVQLYVQKQLCPVLHADRDLARGATDNRTRVVVPHERRHVSVPGPWQSWTRSERRTGKILHWALLNVWQKICFSDTKGAKALLRESARVIKWKAG